MPKLTQTWKQTKGLSCHKRNSSFGLTNSKHGTHLAEFETSQAINDEGFLQDVDDVEKRNFRKHGINTRTNNEIDCASSEVDCDKVPSLSQRRSKRLAHKAFQSNAECTPPPHYKQLILHNVGVKIHNQPCHKKKEVVHDPTKSNTLEHIIDVSDTNAPCYSSQRREFSNSLLLSDWDIPSSVLCQYEASGIISMYEWQVDCLNVGRVLCGENLVYSAPTSAGKTLVAEILMLKCIFEQRRKALVILPFVSVAQEKMHYFRKLLQNTDKKVGGYMGNQYPPGGFTSIDIAVCTIEKANSLINKLIEENGLSSVGIIVVDELHMVGDSHRGYLLELLLTKIQYLQKRSDAFPLLKPILSHHIQLVGMSATLPNLDVLAHWLSASLFNTDYRPVPLIECLKVGSTIFEVGSMEVVRTFSGPPAITEDNDHVIQLCLETVAEGHGIIVFCPTKAWCETLAETIAKEIFILGKDSSDPISHALSHLRDQLRAALNGKYLGDVLDHLKRSTAGLDKLLARTISFGVAFHHAGLTFDERDIIETSFRQGILRVLVATSTLSSGVNLPARRVIIRTPMFHGAPLNVLTYKQMAGRAGRKGMDEHGESFLVCKENERNKACSLVHSELPPVDSCLIVRSQNETNTLTSSLKRAILEIIVSGIATLPSEVQQYAGCTLLAAAIAIRLNDDSSRKSKEDIPSQTIKDCIDFLVENEFIRLQDGDGETGSNTINFIATSLGNAVLASSLSPDDGLVVFRELELARRNFVLENDLHLIYLVVPIYIVDQWNNVDWSTFLKMWEMLPLALKRVGQCVGVKESFLVRASQGLGTQRRTHQLMVHLRFRLALTLLDLINEIPLQTVADKFGCNRGMLQSLQQTVGTFAGMVTVFCHHLGWTSMELLLTHFQNRLQFGVQQELCELVRISYLNGQLARTLYDAGYQSLASLANASARDVRNVLKNAIPFESGKKSIGENAQKSNHHVLWLPGKKSVSEYDAAKLIIEEAQDVLLKDLGVKNIEWTVAADHMKNVFNTESGVSNNGVANNLPQQATLDTRVSEEISSTVRNDVQLKYGSDKIMPDATSKIAIFPNQDEAGTSRQHELMHLSDNNAELINNLDEGNMTSTQATTPVVLKVDSHSVLDVVNGNIDVTKEILVQKSKRNENVEDNSKFFEDSLMLTSQIENILDQNTAVEDPQRRTLDAGVDARSPLSTTDSDRTPSIIMDSDNDIYEDTINWSNVSSPICITDGKSKISGEQLEPDVSDSKTKEQNRRSKHLCAEGNVNVGESSLSEEDLFDSHDSADHSRLLSNTLTSDNDDCIAPTPPESYGTFAKEESTRTPKLIKGGDQVVCTTKLSATNVCPQFTSFQESGLSNHSKPQRCGKGANYTKLMTNCNSVKIIDIEVCVKNPDYYKFVQKWLAESKFSISFAGTKKRQEHGDEVHIGSKFIKDAAPANLPENLPSFNISEETFVIGGLAVCWEPPVAYYLRFCSSCLNCDNNGIRQCDQLIRNIFKAFDCTRTSNRPKVVAFDAKEQYKILYHVCEVLPFKALEDPKVACWLLDPELGKLALYQIVETYLPQQLHLLKDFREIGQEGSIGLLVNGNRLTSRLTSTTEAVLILNLMDCLTEKLNDNDMVPAFIDVEMKSIIPLLRLELNGIGFQPQEYERDACVLKSKLKQLEHEAFSLAGHTFCLSSPTDVAKVLYTELKLPAIDGILDVEDEQFLLPKRPSKMIVKGSTSKILRNLRRSARVSLSTKKDVLHKLEDFHALPKTIIEWRRINSALTKIVLAVQRRKLYVPSIDMYRVYGSYNTFTATGRIVMNEPSIQMVPKDFVSDELPVASKMQSSINVKDVRNRNTCDQNNFNNAGYSNEYGNKQSDLLISLRRAFIPFKGGLLISADYSQLELRLLAHLSQDAALLSALNSDQDVFKAIAAQWKGCVVESVTDETRQQAKQICYGMIYGIGTKALGNNLQVDEAEASSFMESFKSNYPGIRNFTLSVVNKCRKNGYVETLMGRRRYLPAIESNCLQAQSHAERQALNTTIQGSAADIVKKAMILIDQRLTDLFLSDHLYVASKNCKGGFLVLQLHDELVYEVSGENVDQVAKIIKTSMEECVELSVKLTVRIKAGPSWGTMKELHVKTGM